MVEVTCKDEFDKLLELACEGKIASLEEVAQLMQSYHNGTKMRAIAIFGLDRRDAYLAVNFVSVEEYVKNVFDLGRSRYYQLLNYGKALVLLCGSLPIPSVKQSSISESQIREVGNAELWNNGIFIRKMKSLMIHDDVYENEKILLRSLDEIVDAKREKQDGNDNLFLKASYKTNELTPLAKFSMVNREQKKEYFKNLPNKEQTEIMIDMDFLRSNFAADIEKGKILTTESDENE